MVLMLGSKASKARGGGGTRAWSRKERVRSGGLARTHTGREACEGDVSGPTAAPFLWTAEITGQPPESASAFESSVRREGGRGPCGHPLSLS